MIRRPTVFVLGAGASVPFGFPTGPELRRRLCAEMRQGKDLHALLEATGLDGTEVEKARYEFERSGLHSIDSFVAYRPEYQQICETAIAAALLPLEAVSSLTNVGGKHGNADWYQLLWNELLSEVEAADGLVKNSVRFITFNYDRSLEQFLVGAIAGTFGVSQEAAINALRAFPIKHVYGSLGECEPSQGFAYGGHSREQLVERMVRARSSIKTVPSVRGGRDDEAAEWLASAHRVYVLGFGFDPINCDRIGLSDACTRSPDRVTPRHVYATSFQLTHADELWCASNGFTRGSGGPRWIKGDCLALVRELRLELR